MKEMKYMKYLRKMMVFTCLALLGAMQVTAATFKPYKPQQQTKMVRSMYPMATTTPNAAFHSTSVLPSSGSFYTTTTPALNPNGTVNAGAYGVGAAGPRRAKMGDDDDEGGGLVPPDDPNAPHYSDEDNPDQTTTNGFPIGDAVIPLLMMSLAFCGYLYLRHKRSEA